ncbi:unnamed protein product [Linum trigynum]|uniref:Hydroxyproline-rich glycoprotein family protein n=1 Tax=Linum trigynum TaxID=586398 RepID=A0AAV2EC90_9ROSI
MGSEQNRFPLQERRKRWGGCLGSLSCFGAQKGGKRIVPASRIPDGNASVTQPNGPHQAAGMANQATTISPSLLAPPSSPASFSNSGLPSTAQSPNNFLSLSANSPGGPSSTMFATGPYAHEQQLVSPPVFSTYTTEPSTAPLTPPPELAHLTTPSSPDVPFAQFLSSSAKFKSSGKGSYHLAANDLQAAYALYPGSPASSLLSPKSKPSHDCLSSSFPEREFPPHWDPSVSPQNGECSRSDSGRLCGHDRTSPSMVSQDSNFFCPDTFARFYLDHNPLFPHTAGRLSVSKDSDVYPTVSNGHTNSRNNKSPKQDVEEVEAYRASFGFSADEIITTTQYVEISDVMDDSFTMNPFTSSKSNFGDVSENVNESESQKLLGTQRKLPRQQSLKSKPDVNTEEGCEVLSSDRYKGMQPGNISGSSTPPRYNLSGNEGIFSRNASSKGSRKYHAGLSSSDAEIDYRRVRSSREGRREIMLGTSK